METQGTLDAFYANHVSSDATAVSGRIDRIIWPKGSDPPRLGFVQPDVPHADQRSLPLTSILGEPVRVQLQSERYCTKCGATAEQSVCYDCAGTPPLAACVKQPAERCQYADCPYPEYKKQSCAHEFVVYLVTAAGVKVGITKRTRTLSRWQEQGANHALPIATAPNRKAAGIIERAVSQVDYIGQRLRHEWYEPMNAPEERLVDAVLDAREAFPDRLLDCFRWPSSVPREEFREEIVSVPYLDTPELSHRLVSRHGHLQPGNAREGRVVGVRGALIATDAFVINTRRFAGHCITIETEAPFVESFDADSVTNESTVQADSNLTQADDGKKAVPDGGEESTESDDLDYPIADFF